MVYTLEKEKAILLRRDGGTYSEILRQIPVAKSTLTEWFREVKLTTPQFQRLTEKKLAASKRGGEAKHRQRIERQQNIRTQALKDITHISKRELWLIGVALYWAEGTKEKDFHTGTGIVFNNSDPRMIKVFIKWLLESCEVGRDRIGFSIYIHENSKNSVDEARKFWSQVAGFSIDNFTKVYFKKNKIETNRRNINNLYYGLLRVRVNASSTILRQVTGWTEAIVENIK